MTTNVRVEVITSVQRRRRWSRDEKERIVAAALVPSANASAIAREAGIHVSQLFRWRQQLCERSQEAAGFAAVAVAPGPLSPPLPAADVIEIEFATGHGCRSPARSMRRRCRRRSGRWCGRSGGDDPNSGGGSGLAGERAQAMDRTITRGVPLRPSTAGRLCRTH
jgi:transposase